MNKKLKIKNKGIPTNCLIISKYGLNNAFFLMCENTKKLQIKKNKFLKKNRNKLIKVTTTYEVI